MQITLNIRKTLEENAAVYFEKAKKAKRKIPGIKEAIANAEQKIRELEDKKDVEETEAEAKKAIVKRQKEWFEKYRWCVTSDGFLLIGGRDATTNDMIIKKQLEPSDLVIHTEAAGSPFIIIKNPEKKEIPESTREEAAELCGIFSRAWKAQHRVAEVFLINPDQVSKEAQSGEYLSKGSFMIYGHKKYYRVDLHPAIVVHEGRAMCGPLKCVEAYAKARDVPFLELVHGDEKISNVAKQIARTLQTDVDSVLQVIPQGCVIKKKK